MSTKQFNFEKSSQELEEIVSKFESGDIGIEQGLKDFEQGMKLAQDLQKRLKDAENKVVEIKKKFESNE